LHEKYENDINFREATHVSSSSQTDFDQAVLKDTSDSENTIEEEDKQQKEECADVSKVTETPIRYRSSIIIENSRPRACSTLNYNYIPPKDNIELNFKRLRFTVNSNGQSLTKPISQSQNLNENFNSIKTQTSRLTPNNETLYRFVTKIRFS
jgi:hypothetical protein